MLDTIIAYSSRPDLSGFNGILDRSPRFKSHSLASIRAVQEKEINVAQATYRDRL